MQEAERFAPQPYSGRVVLKVGRLETGPENAITDVRGVHVGHRTVVLGQDIRTGVTAILPHNGSLWHDRVPCGLAVANGFGKLMGATQLVELGELETPVLLTNTLSVPQAAEAILEWTLSCPGADRIRSINPVVGETNDGRLSAIEKRAVTRGHALDALASATDRRPEEGNVGAGTGTAALGWKAGIGTSSRKLSEAWGESCVGVLVQSNFGGRLRMLGVPVGELLAARGLGESRSQDPGYGSIMIVLATDAPLSDRNLTRVARRTFAGLARTGASFSNGSGDYAIAFSTAESVRRTPKQRCGTAQIVDLPNELMSPVFEAAIEATEEAIYRSLIAARTMSGREGVTVHALPWDEAVGVLRDHGKRV
jgi:D-aminopeptidase